MHRRTIVPALLLVAVAPGLAPVHAEETPPAPDFARVDHARPADALGLCTAFAEAGVLRELASDLEAEGSLETIRAVDGWIRTQLTYDPNAAYRWRTLAEMQEDGTYGGCADHAVVFGQLLRAAGVPTVFVKTMDADWIRAFVRGPEPGRWSGHCFLEVHVDGRWRLLDASAMVLYDDYDPRQRILPGGRWAYDKGHDPFALVMSMRWELWKRQTRAHFRGFDLARLPVGEGRDLRGGPVVVGDVPPALLRLPVSVIGHPRHTRRLTAHLREGGVRVNYTYDWKFDTWVPKGRGGWMYVLAPQKEPALPESHLRDILGSEGYAELEASFAKHTSGVWGRRAADGTRLFVVYAQDEEALQRAIAAVPFLEPREVGAPPAR